MFKNKSCVAEIQREILGNVTGTLLIKINSECLGTNGDISFPANLLAWKGLISQESYDNDCRNILEYYLQKKNYETAKLSALDILRKATELLISASESWALKVNKCCLATNRVLLFLDRTKTTEFVIKECLASGIDYGKVKSMRRSVDLKINQDKTSDLTNTRLNLIKEVSQRIFEAQTLTVDENNAKIRYILTIKSQGALEDGYSRYVCGVVKNHDSDTKETCLTWESYIDNIINDLANLVKYKKLNDTKNLKDMAEAVATFELLSVKPNRPAFVQTNRDSCRGISNSKGGIFVLYNAARISAILNRFKEEECLGNYPILLDVNKVDFSLLNQEEEWELVYNFILQYPELIDNCAQSMPQFETHPQMLCLFLSRLCQKFSAYYRRIRVLTEGRDHLVPTMMARLHLLRALQIVVNNSLAILNITPVDHM